MSQFSLNSLDSSPSADTNGSLSPIHLLASVQAFTMRQVSRQHASGPTWLILGFFLELLTKDLLQGLGPFIHSVRDCQAVSYQIPGGWCFRGIETTRG